MKTKLAAGTRLLLLIAAAGLIAVLFNPIWRIELNAPQYPEGLSLQIHANGLKGNVDIINGLNHYIGMKTLHNEDFVEFKILPYAIVFFAVLFLLSALLNKRWLLYTSFVLFVLFGILAMYDFWKWEYDYGHNLNPDAAIKVPGMAYQPPLIGFKQLLNFGAYSIPDTGGWLFIGAGVLLLVAVIVEWRKSKAIKPSAVAYATSVILLTVLFSSCNTGPEAIAAGKDNCSHCKMGISDIKYAAEMVTQKGKVYKFDDINCLVSFIKDKTVAEKDINQIYFSDFSAPHNLVKSGEAFLLQGGSIHAPMNGNIVAFSNKDSLTKAISQLGAAEVSWQQVSK
ncbi:MAG: nitrous oxide reductase accessory protein NosL [Chitinophagaceae bacterium]|nr:nitrous oxide reductase accessory protein NosL [Chitinophagaceae bacterium]